MTNENQDGKQVGHQALQAPALVEAISRLRAVEERMHEAAKFDEEKAECLIGAATWREAEGMLRATLDKLEIEFSELGFDMSSVAALSVGRTVQDLFGEY